ncbi:hypothetical protein SESBI_01235 [Sesbania bispinosa]|nr:hypothetical protein SESBI_01235 [Sesbania bispinosa]
MELGRRPPSTTAPGQFTKRDDDHTVVPWRHDIARPESVQMAHMQGGKGVALEEA